MKFVSILWVIIPAACAVASDPGSIVISNRHSASPVNTHPVAPTNSSSVHSSSNVWHPSPPSVQSGQSSTPNNLTPIIYRQEYNQPASQPSTQHTAAPIVYGQPNAQNASPNTQSGAPNTGYTTPIVTPVIIYRQEYNQPANQPSTQYTTTPVIYGSPTTQSGAPNTRYTTPVVYSQPNVSPNKETSVGGTYVYSGSASVVYIQPNAQNTASVINSVKNPVKNDSSNRIIIDSAVSTGFKMVGVVAKYYEQGGANGVPIEFSPLSQNVVQPALPFHPNLALAGTVVKDVVPFASAAYSGAREFQNVSNSNLSGEEKAAHVIFSSSLSLAASAVSLVNPYVGVAVGMNYSASEDFLFDKMVEQPGRFLGGVLYDSAPGLFQ